MPRNITVTFSDGTSHVYQNAPDNITPDQVLARVGQEFADKTVANLNGGRGGVPGPRAAAPSEKPNASSPTLAERALGSELGRLALGAATPFVGAAQLGANIGDYINEQTGTTPVVGPAIAKWWQNIQAMKQRGMEASAEGQIARSLGQEPTDALGVVGGALTGGGGLGAANTAEKVIGRSAALGGVYGLATPGTTSGEEQLRNAALGAGLGAAIPAAAPVVSKAVGKVMDLRRLPDAKAVKMARDALGSDLPATIEALRAAEGSGQTAAQATAGINSPLWQALVARYTGLDPRFQRAMSTAQETDSLNALARLAGGATAADVRATNELAKQILTDVTSPARQAALARANRGQDVARLDAEAIRLAEQATGKVEDVRRLVKAGQIAENASHQVQPSAKGELLGLPRLAGRYSYPGELAKQADQWASQAATASLDLGQGARFAQSAADSLRQAGIKPLESSGIIRAVKIVGNNPEFAGNDVLSGALNNVARDIAEWTSKGGVIDARALDAIRKNSVNAAIQQLRPGMDATQQRNLAAGVMSNLKPLLIDAIEAAGGKGYRSYLEDYATGMRKISENKLVGEAQRLWKKDKDAFVQLVENESPDVVEKILGSGSYNIAQELGQDTIQALKEQAQKHLINLTIKAQVSEGQDALRQLLLDNVSKFRLPSYLSALVSTTNKSLQILEQKIGRKTMKILTEQLKMPGQAADLLERLPAQERNRVLKLLSNPSQWKSVIKPATTGATVGVTNALTTQENQNALAEQ